MVSRGINPDTIVFDANFTTLLFADIRSICVAESDDHGYVINEEPYDSVLLQRMNGLGNVDPRRDIWSVGVVLLEVIVGTRLIMDCQTFTDVSRLLKATKEFIDDATAELLQNLLLSNVVPDLEDYITNLLDKNTSIIAESTRGVQQATRDAAKVS